MENCLSLILKVFTLATFRESFLFFFPICIPLCITPFANKVMIFTSKRTTIFFQLFRMPTKSRELGFPSSLWGTGGMGGRGMEGRGMRLRMWRAKYKSAVANVVLKVELMKHLITFFLEFRTVRNDKPCHRQPPIRMVPSCLSSTHETEFLHY